MTSEKKVAKFRSHPERHAVSRIGWLRAAVLGANDGIISTASLIVGVAASGADKPAILISGGAALVAAFLARRPVEREVGAKMLLAVAAFGVATIGFGLSRNLFLSLAMLVLIGAADMVSVYIRTTLVQLHTPDTVRGRVSAISGLAISCSNELGDMQSGVAAALLGATGAVVFGGVGAIVVTLAWAIGFPELRRARTFAAKYQS